MKNWLIGLGTAVISAAILLAAPALATPKYGKHLCSDPDYTCYRVLRGDTWKKLFPNARERNLVMRINRTNLPLYNRRWVAVPNNLQHTDLFDHSPFPSEIQAPNEKVLIVNLGLHAFAAYNKHGHLVHWGPISGGKGWCPDTNSRCNTVIGDNFRVFRKSDQSCVSKKFPIGKGGAKMPYCMFFHGGYAMHGSPLPGYHASHGCIRMRFDDAQWLNKSFIQLPKKGQKGTRVIVVRS